MADQNETVAALSAENAALRLELEAVRRELAEVRQSRALLGALIEHSPSNISVIDLDKRILLVNPVSTRAMGLRREDLEGKTQYELFGDETVAAWDVSDRAVIESGAPLATENVVPLPDGDHTFLAIKFPLFDEQRRVYAIGNIVTDITAQKRVEQERSALQQEIIEVQRTALRELSTPLVPIADGVVAMPLVGEIDGQRAQQILETLLEGVSQRQADVAIIDITGVKVVDTQVAQSFIRAAQAVGLLGARVVITGIGAEVAQSLVHLGADLSRIVTRSDLQSGIAYALEARG